MDSVVVVVAADFSLHTGIAAQTASHPQAIVSGVLPQQQPPSLAKHINDYSSHVSAVHLQIIGTPTPAIVALSNT
jgi:ABC-type phosphate/phosphonate transport system permease subunit